MQVPPSPSKPSLARRVLFVMLPTIFLFAAIELVVRGYLLARYGQLVPSQNWSFEYEPYFVASTSIKEHRDYPFEENQYRVLVLGGSTAAQVPDDVLVDALQPLMDRRVVVMNMAEGGFILNQEKVMLMLRGIPARPDLILCLDGANDIVVASKLHRTGETYHVGLVRTAVEHPYLNAVFATARRSQFIAGLTKWRERSAEISFGGAPGLDAEVVQHIAEGWQSMAVVARGLEVPIVLVLQPYLHLKPELTEAEQQLSGRYEYRRDFMKRMFEKAWSELSGLRLAGEAYALNGTRFFDEAGSVDVFKDEVHLTREGNELFAAELVERSRSHGLQIGRARRADAGDSTVSPDPIGVAGN